MPALKSIERREDVFTAFGFDFFVSIFFKKHIYFAVSVYYAYRLCILIGGVERISMPLVVKPSILFFFFFCSKAKNSFRVDWLSAGTLVGWMVDCVDWID